MQDPFAYQEQWDTPAGPLDVMTIAEGDEHDLLRFFRRRLSDRSNLFLFLHAEQTDEEALTTMRQRIAAHQRRYSLVFVARQQNVIVGYFFLDRLFSPTGDPPSIGIGLADALHGVGIGGRFMDLLIESARTLGHSAIQLTHHPENARAAALYLRKGFRYTGEQVTWQTSKGPRTEPRMLLDLRAPREAR